MWPTLIATYTQNDYNNNNNICRNPCTLYNLCSCMHNELVDSPPPFHETLIMCIKSKAQAFLFFPAYHVDYNFNLDKIFGSDNKRLKHNDILKFLAKSERLRAKPKLLFIQACQGGNPGAEAVIDRLSDVTTDDDKISEYTDFYLSCASVAGDRSYRDIFTGES